MIQMESSFLEDLLKKDVDQNQVNALVGSLENQLTTPRSSATPPKPNIAVKPDNITSASNLIPKAAATSTPPPNNFSSAGYVRYVQSPPISSHTNGSISFDKKLLVTNTNVASPHPVLPRSNLSASIISTGSPKPVTPPASRQLDGTAITTIVNSVNSVTSHVTPQVSIAPKIITNAVPIAPRIATNMGTNIMISPRHAQLLMSRQLGPNALLQGNLIAQMPGIPVVPRIPGGAIAVPPIMNTQIPGIRTVLPGAGPSLINMSQQGQKVVPRMAALTAQIPGTSLSQVKTNTSIIPGQINYRFRQVNPNSILPTTQVKPTVNGVTTQAAAQAQAANITMMKESVKRLKDFFQNLINLACGPNQRPEIGKTVKELVHNLMQSRVSEEEFIEKLQKTLNSDPQPNLVHFLKKTLPHLRDTIKKQQMQQQMQSKIISSSAALAANQLRPSISTITGGIGRPPTILNGQTRLPHHILTNKNLTLQEQQVLQKQLAQQGRLIVASSNNVNSPGGIRAGLQGPLHGVSTLTNQKGLLKNPMGATPQMLLNANSAKEKPRNTYYSSAIGGDDDINDVTCMAGVNLMEESQKILATGADFMSYQTRSVKDKLFIDVDRLKSHIERTAVKCGLQGVSPDALAIISHALEDRLRTLLERLTTCSIHRNDPHAKEDVRYETISTVRNQLRVFEEIDEVERKHRESREREMLMRVAKSRTRIEDPEQARLKEKAKQMQQEEEEMNRKRAANRTALEAIGGPRKKRKLDEALESLSKSQKPGSGSTSTSTSDTSTSNSLSSQTRSRQHRITLRDLIFILETEKRTCKSAVLYRLYLR